MQVTCWEAKVQGHCFLSLLCPQLQVEKEVVQSGCEERCALLWALPLSFGHVPSFLYAHLPLPLSVFVNKWSCTCSHSNQCDMPHAWQKAPGSVV